MCTKGCIRGTAPVWRIHSTLECSAQLLLPLMLSLTAPAAHLARSYAACDTAAAVLRRLPHRLGHHAGRDVAAATQNSHSCSHCPTPQLDKPLLRWAFAQVSGCCAGLPQWVVLLLTPWLLPRMQLCCWLLLLSLRRFCSAGILWCCGTRGHNETVAWHVHVPVLAVNNMCGIWCSNKGWRRKAGGYGRHCKHPPPLRRRAAPLRHDQVAVQGQPRRCNTGACPRGVSHRSSAVVSLQSEQLGVCLAHHSPCPVRAITRYQKYWQRLKDMLPA